MLSIPLFFVQMSEHISQGLKPSPQMVHWCSVVLPWSQGDAINESCHDKWFCACFTGCHSHETTRPIQLNSSSMPRSMILQSLRGLSAVAGESDQVGGCIAFTGEPDLLGGTPSSSRSLWERGGAARRGGPFPLEASSLCRDVCQSCSSTSFYDTNQWCGRLPVFLYSMWNDVMTASLELQLIVEGLLLGCFVH